MLTGSALIGADLAVGCALSAYPKRPLRMVVLPASLDCSLGNLRPVLDRKAPSNERIVVRGLICNASRPDPARKGLRLNVCREAIRKPINRKQIHTL